MLAGPKIQAFLKRKMAENNLKRVDVAKGADMSSGTIHTIYDGSQNNVAFQSVLRLANFFDCSLDEVFGRDQFETSKVANYKTVNLEQVMRDIRDFINGKIEEEGIDVYKFAKGCGLDKEALRHFARGKDNHQTLRSNNILAIVDKYNISIDQLIGRSSTD